MSAPTAVRAATKRRLHELLLAALPAAGGDVAVAYGFPGQGLEREHVWVGAARGDQRVRAMSAGRRLRADSYSVDVWIRVEGLGDEIETVEQRAEEILGFVELVIADNTTLADLDGQVRVTVGQVEGPDGELLAEGAVSVIRAQLDCEARLS